MTASLIRAAPLDADAAALAGEAATKANPTIFTRPTGSGRRRNATAVEFNRSLFSKTERWARPD